MKHGLAGLLAKTLLATALGACSDVPVEEPGVIDLDPQGVIEGSVLYVGPRPRCVYDENDRPLRIPGVLMLTLINDADPLPPEGTAQQPENFLAIAGGNLFTTDDCPSDPDVYDPTDLIMRSVDFTWPQISLAKPPAETVKYRVAAFYDMEGDFNPFFTITSSTSAGDVSGAALRNAQEVPPQFELVTFHSTVARPLGEVVRGVTVTVGGVVNTEPPIFRIVDGELSSQQPVPSVTSPHGMQNNLLTNSSITLRLFGQGHAPLATSSDPDDQDLERMLERLRDRGQLLGGGTGPVGPRLLDPDFTDPVAYAWYHQLLDTNNDGQIEDHPILGQIGAELGPEFRIQLASPVVYLQRHQTPEEIRAGIPSVAIQAASVNRNKGNFPAMPEVEYPDTRVIVPPIAAVLLDPSESACQVPYMPPGTPREYFEFVPNAPIECAEIPTGPYAVNVLHGVVAGTVVDDPSSETGFALVNGQFASQVWAVPNALGDVSQVGDLLPEGTTPDIVESQGLAGAVRFVDPDPSTPLGRQDVDPNDPTHACNNAPGFVGSGRPNYQSFPTEGTGCGPNDARPIEDLCCESVRHLCNVPLCPYDECNPGIIASPREGRGSVRAVTYTDSCGVQVTVERYVPECIPFYMPTVCCEDTWATNPPPAQMAPFGDSCD